VSIVLKDPKHQRWPLQKMPKMCAGISLSYFYLCPQQKLNLLVLKLNILAVHSASYVQYTYQFSAWIRAAAP
jgi:hypothetical protein